MTSNYFLTSKAEASVFGLDHLRNRLPEGIITLIYSLIITNLNPNYSVKNLGVLFDQELSFWIFDKPKQ